MRSRSRSESGPKGRRNNGSLEFVRVRGPQRELGAEGRGLKRGRRRRGGRGRRPSVSPPPRPGLWGWLRGLFTAPRGPSASEAGGPTDLRVCRAFCQQYGLPFNDLGILALALSHRSYVHSGEGRARDSNERLEFLGDSVLGLVVTDHLYRTHPDEHEGQLTKTKSLLVSKAILSRRALAMGLGRFVLMSQSEVESGGRQRLSILADAFEAVIGAVYLDLGYDQARSFIERWLLRDTRAILSDKRHTNYKSQLQEYVQSTFRTHPIYHIRSQMGPDHSKVFMVEVLVGRRVLGSGKGRNKKEAEQAAARDALERQSPEPEASRRPDSERALPDDGGLFRRDDQERSRRAAPGHRERAAAAEEEEEEGDVEPAEAIEADAPESSSRGAEDSWRRSRRRGGRGRRIREEATPVRSVPEAAAASPSRGEEAAPPIELEPEPPLHEEEDLDEVGRPEAPFDERRVDPYAWDEMPLPREPLEAGEAPEGKDVTEDEAEPLRKAREWEDEETTAVDRAPQELEAPPAGSAESPAPPANLYGRRAPRRRTRR